MRDPTALQQLTDDAIFAARVEGAPDTLLGILEELRRSIDAGGAELEPIAVPELGIVIDPDQRAAFRNGAMLDLSRLEYELLVRLAREPRRVFAAAQLLHDVWRYEHPDRVRTRTVDSHMSRLRRMLGSSEVCINRRGAGWSLLPPAVPQ